jgi:hypothetical protein
MTMLRWYVVGLDSWHLDFRLAFWLEIPHDTSTSKTRARAGSQHKQLAIMEMKNIYIIFQFLENNVDMVSFYHADEDVDRQHL